MSTHRVDVVQLGPIEKHPNADTLGITKIYDYTVVVRLSDWKPGDLGVYIEPDYVVPETEQFAFLGSSKRVKVKRLRGVMSQGLLIPAPPGAQPGQDLMRELGIERYDPGQAIFKGAMRGALTGDNDPGPNLMVPKYDLENGRRHRQIVDACELLVVTEKIHGTNARFVHDGTRLHVGSRTTWKSPSSNTVWNRMPVQEPWIAKYCEEHPGTVLYGEIYGAVQDLHYGCGPGEIKFAAFDIYQHPHFMNSMEFHDTVPVNLRVPHITVAKPFEINGFIDGPSVVPGADHIREGIVVKPLLEAKTDRLERVAYKFVSDAYLERD